MKDATRISLPQPSAALPGREQEMRVPARHFVNGHPLRAPFPAGMQCAVFALGCFWGAERRFWQQTGVYSTAVGYTAGVTPNPDYREVCSGRTGHTEAVHVVFDPDSTSFGALLKVFWESHDPTQGMRQGNDADTDDGGVSDGQEVSDGTDPLDTADDAVDEGTTYYKGGCGCSSAPETTAPSMAVLGLGLATLLARRRRR